MTQFEHGHALLIGVGADLPITVNDATGLADFLKNPAYCAYPPQQVKLLTETQSTRSHILKAFDELASAATGEDTVIIYFSGHGYVSELPLVGETYFLMPHGYDVKNLAQTAIQGRELAEKLRAIPAQKMLILLDCCHAGGLDAEETKGVTLVKSSMLPESAELLAEGSGYVFIGSSRADELSYAGKPYSVFTYALLEALAGEGVAKKDGFVRVADIAGYCREIIPRRTEKRAHGIQHPVFNFSQADNFAVAYYAAGDNEPKGVPFTPLQVEEPEAALQSIFDQQGQTVHGNQTNIGTIDGDVGQIGDSYHQHGGVSIQGDGQISIGGSVVSGDQWNFASDLRGTTVQSSFENILQAVDSLPHGNTPQRAAIKQSLSQLFVEFAQAPNKLAEEIENLSERLEWFFEEVAEEAPDLDVVDKFAERVTTVAAKTSVTLPTVSPLVRDILDKSRAMLFKSG